MTDRVLDGMRTLPDVEFDHLPPAALEDIEARIAVAAARRGRDV